MPSRYDAIAAPTIKSTIPFRLDKFGPIRRHVLLNGLLCASLVHLAFEQHVEAAEPSLARDPRHARLPIQLESDDLVAEREVSVDKGIEHRPEHLGLGACKSSSNGLANRRTRAIGSEGVLAAKSTATARHHVDAVVVLGEGVDLLAVGHAVAA